MAKGNKGRDKLKNPFRKTVRQKIKSLGSDGRISKRDTRRIAKTSGGELSNRRIKRMLNRYSSKSDVKIKPKKFGRLIRKFNVAKTGNNPVDNTSPEMEVTGPTLEEPTLEGPTLEEKLTGIQDSYTEDMALADDPRNRRYVLGIRTKRGERNRQGARGAFGRKGKRIKGLQNTSINL